MDEEFEDFDVAADEGGAGDEQALSAEALGGLADEAGGVEAVAAARDHAERMLLLDPQEAMAAMADDGPAGPGNVVGIGVGEKVSGGNPSGSLAVKVFVKEKLSPRHVSDSALVPEEIGGLPTDVEAIGEIDAQMFTKRVRPAPGGVSIGHCSKVHAGTLGCLVKKGNGLFILSNNHVIALSNAAPIGSKIPQPGRLDGGVCPPDIIATLTQFVPINFSGACNFVDAAIGQTNPKLVDRRVLCPLQKLQLPHVGPALNMNVKKAGRTTQCTAGVVSAVNVTVNVNYGVGVAKFCRQFLVKGTPGPFSKPGDSGSLIRTRQTNQPVGLLFAGNASTNTTIANPIGAVLSALGVQIVN